MTIVEITTWKNRLSQPGIFIQNVICHYFDQQLFESRCNREAIEHRLQIGVSLKLPNEKNRNSGHTN